MQVFKTYFKILKKQLTSILIYGAIFLGITILTTSSYRNQGNEQFKPQKVNALVVNEDGQNEFVNGFIEYLEKYVTYVEIEDNEEARKDALFYRKVEYIITIPEGFTEAFSTGEGTNLQKQIIPDSVEALAVDNAINNYFNTLKVYKKHMPELGYAQLNSYIEQNLEKETSVAFDVVHKYDKAYSDQFNKNYFNYLGYIIIAIFISGVSTVMLSFQNIDIRRRHNSSPITSRNMNIQLIFANFIFVICYLLVFIVAGYICNPYRRIDANTILYWTNAIVFALVALSLSYLVGIAVKSKKAIGALSTAVSLSLAFISGMFVPQEYLGESVLKVASFTPSYWFIKANNTIATVTSYGWDNISGILAMMAIQLGFAAALISIAMVVSKRKSQQAN